jgi:hypothetical protein
VVQKHTQMPGRGQTDRNVVGPDGRGSLEDLDA